MNLSNIKDIAVESLLLYGEDKYADTISKFKFDRNDFRGDPCFYKREKAENGRLGGDFLICSIKDGVFEINTNLLMVREYEYNTGKRYNHTFSSINKNDYQLDLSNPPKYETNFGTILSSLREKRFKKLLE